MLYFIVFVLGCMCGVALMCLFQINRMEKDIVPGDKPQGEGGHDEQQSKRA